MNKSPERRIPAGDIDQKQKELTGERKPTNANSSQNQNAGNSAPIRHLKSDSAGRKNDNEKENEDDRSRKSAGGTDNAHEDAALVKEEIRSRDA